MKKIILILFVALIISFCIADAVSAQCSICAKTAQQMGEKPALGLNSGILYLMAIPYVIVGVIGFRWWRSNSNNS